MIASYVSDRKALSEVHQARSKPRGDLAALLIYVAVDLVHGGMANPE